MKIEEIPVNSDGWTKWILPEDRRFREVCCDCGLAHDLEFRVRKGQAELRWRRNERSTAQVRRHMKKGKV